jgi:hypothetical protein
MRKVAFFSAMLLLVSTVAHAAIVTLNFDDLAGGTDLLNTTYNGVFFTSPSAQPIVVYVGNNFGAGSSSPLNSIVTGPSGMGTLKVVFPYPVHLVGITGGDAGGDTDSFHVEYYTSSDLIYASFDTGVFGGNALKSDGTYGDSLPVLTTVGGDVIAYVLFIPTSASGLGISWDDLQFEGTAPVPEPSTMLLLGSGLAGLVGYGRRRLKK